MEPIDYGIIGMIALAVMIALGVRIFVASGIVGFCGLWALKGFDRAVGIAGHIPYSDTTNYALSVLPLFMWLQATPTTMTLILVQSAFCTMVGIFVGVAPAALSEMFPVGVRSTGMSLVYNTAITIFGGFAPAILTWFTQVSGGSVFAPGWYVMAASVLALFSLLFMPGRHAQRATG